MPLPRDVAVNDEEEKFLRLIDGLKQSGGGGIQELRLHGTCHISCAALYALGDLKNLTNFGLGVNIPEAAVSEAALLENQPLQPFFEDPGLQGLLALLSKKSIGRNKLNEISFLNYDDNSQSLPVSGRIRSLVREHGLPWIVDCISGRQSGDGWSEEEFNIRRVHHRLS
ncbi:hypothetical protein BDB00DRAFT_819521 [Zychaea mexicana]|uniref:uncharacterized protein n=1 Tax=Zychaea mexicana TaxID=64656 RepID=UPI0022FEC0EE|nr:uncharacterized protein BDB00DRAFT_819521 [Zychaea mexicana]KAI9494286.1 hypothetical protein BDB00DRAFT_819521 [Zychaea mexicana]